MGLVISTKIRSKLASKHRVTPDEILECFANRTGGFLLDSREEHKSDPPTQWFISETDYGRLLKIVFVLREGDIFIRTAYEPNDVEQQIYKRKSCV